MVMLGSPCSPCCSPCACTDGQLFPDYVTVTFNNFEHAGVKIDNLTTLAFSSCFGAGAAATVTAPGGNPESDRGPITGVTLANPGSGYARLRRVEPKLNFSGSGSGAEFDATLSQSQDECGLDRWALESVSVSGGTGYVDGEELTITVAAGDIAEVIAKATISTGTSEPTLTVAGNAVTTISLTNNNNGTWSIASVSVQDQGSGYTDGEQLEVTLGEDDVEDVEAQLFAVVTRVQPTLLLDVAGGIGALLTPTLTETSDPNGRPYWQINSVTIANGGSGYAVDDLVYATIVDGEQDFFGGAFAATVASVNGSGAITSITLVNAGGYFKWSGELESVIVANGGIYWKNSGEPVSVTVTEGGVHYREDSELEPYVAEVTVNIVQQLGEPFAGEGAVVTATVNTDTTSPDFGKIASLTLQEQGDGYLLWRWDECSLPALNGRSITVPNAKPLDVNGDPLPGKSCRFSRCVNLMGPGNKPLAVVIVELRGQSPPLIRIDVPDLGVFSCPCVQCIPLSITMTTDSQEEPFGCSGTIFTASYEYGGTATVTAGATGEPTFDMFWDADEIIVTLTGADASFTVEYPQGDPDNPQCKATNKDNASIRVLEGGTNGSSFNGSFACKFEYVDGLNRRVYLYSVGTLCDEDMYVGVRLTSSPIPINVQFGTIEVIGYGLALSYSGLDEDGNPIAAVCANTFFSTGGIAPIRCTSDSAAIPQTPQGGSVPLGTLMSAAIAFSTGEGAGAACEVDWTGTPAIVVTGITIGE